MKKVFIDGEAGTTGLRIRERLAQRADLEFIHLDEALRKDVAARTEALNAADLAFLCLPDAAAKEAVSLVQNPETVIIDTSTAHRVHDAWVYGFPELTGLRDQIRQAKRIANPGCHASGFIALVAPLVEAQLLPEDALLSCTSLTGYSGGGKAMIAQYEACLGAQQSEAKSENAGEATVEAKADAKTEGEAKAEAALQQELLQAPRLYGLTQAHKHLPEMQKYCNLKQAPAFCPVVSSYYSGMEAVITLFASQVNGTIEQVKECLAAYYAQAKLVRFCSAPDEQGFLSAAAYAGRDSMQLAVFGNAERMVLTARFDNLGKGASGAAIQNMNIALGLDETTGLCL